MVIAFGHDGLYLYVRIKNVMVRFLSLLRGPLSNRNRSSKLILTRVKSKIYLSFGHIHQKHSWMKIILRVLISNSVRNGNISDVFLFRAGISNNR